MPLTRLTRRTRPPPPYFLVTAFTTMMLVTGMNILVPALPAYARSFEVSTAEVGVVVAAFAVGRLIFDVVGGTLSDRFGMRAVCVAGCAITGGASLVAGLTNSFPILLGARLVQGTGSALYMNAATALVVALLPAGKAGRWMSAYQGIFLMGLAVGPLLGGGVADLFGLRAPFHAYAMMCLVGLVLSLTRLPGRSEVDRLMAATPHGRSSTTVGRGEALRQLLRHPAFVISLLVILAMFIVRSGFRNTAVPLYAHDVLHMAAGPTGLLVTAAAVGQLSVMWHAGKSLDTRGRRPVVVVSLFAAAASIMVFALAVEPWLLLLFMLLVGVVTAYSTSAPTVVMVDITGPEIRGTAIGIQRMATDFGQLVGPILVGLILDSASYQLTFLIIGGMVLLTAVVSLRLPETSRATPTGVPSEGQPSAHPHRRDSTGHRPRIACNTSSTGPAR